jgi:hypothetical protein
MNRTNFLLEPLQFMERNGILFPREYLRDRTIKSDNGMFLTLFFSFYPPFGLSSLHFLLIFTISSSFAPKAPETGVF